MTFKRNNRSCISSWSILRTFRYFKSHCKLTRTQSIVWEGEGVNFNIWGFDMEDGEAEDDTDDGKD